MNVLGTGNPCHMIFQIQKVSNYGTSTPAVARTFFQGCEILQFFSVSDVQREEAKAPLYELQRHLVRCVEIRDQITTEVVSAQEEIKRKGFQFQSGGQAITLPSVVDLQSRAESFLQSAKLAIRDTAHLVKPFYGQRLDHRYHKFVAWAQRKFGPSDAFTQAIRSWEPWVKRVVDMRNAVDHPEDKSGGTLITQNFNIARTPDAPALVGPTWGLSGQSQVPMVADMDGLIEGIIQLGEEVLSGLFYKLKDDFPLVIYEIPIEQRNPSCPVRLRVGPASNAPIK